MAVDAHEHTSVVGDGGNTLPDLAGLTVGAGGFAELNGGVALTGAGIFRFKLTANAYNNFAPSSLTAKHTLFLTTSALWHTLTGISSAGHVDGQVLEVFTGGPGNIVLAYQATPSAASNRIVGPGNSGGFVIRPGGGVRLRRITSLTGQTRWRVMAA